MFWLTQNVYCFPDENTKGIVCQLCLYGISALKSPCVSHKIVWYSLLSVHLSVCLFICLVISLHIYLISNRRQTWYAQFICLFLLYINGVGIMLETFVLLLFYKHKDTAYLFWCNYIIISQLLITKCIKNHFYGQCRAPLNKSCKTYILKSINITVLLFTTSSKQIKTLKWQPQLKSFPSVCCVTTRWRNRPALPPLCFAGRFCRPLSFCVEVALIWTQVFFPSKICWIFKWV